LERYKKGIYYRAQETPFGKTKMNPVRIIQDMYLNKNGMTIGYETGASFYNQIGLTTQMSKYKYYATNAFKQNGNRVDENMKVMLRKPVTTVTEENHQYLQLLDVIENKDHVEADALHTGKFILEYIRSERLDFVKLVGYASKYYRKEVLLRLGGIATEVLL
jgi:hypothetical protein